MAGMDIAPITRMQDFSIIKHNEDTKAATEQMNLGQQAEKNTVARGQEVVHSENSDWHNRRQDAREKGSNEYSGDGGTRRGKNGRILQEDRVVVKGQSGGFDLKV